MTNDQLLTTEEQMTVDAYDEHAKQWANEHNTADFWEAELTEFKKLLPQGRILEIGCGGGRDAKQLIKSGYDYLGTDISAGLIEQAQSNNPTGTFIKKSVYDLNFSHEFDGFWASAVLLHIPKSRIDQALQQLHNALKDNGIGFISIKQGSGVQTSIDSLDDGTEMKRFFAFYNPQEFAEILQQNGFEIVSQKIRPMSAKTTWLIYFVKVVNH